VHGKYYRREDNIKLKDLGNRNYAWLWTWLCFSCFKKLHHALDGLWKTKAKERKETKEEGKKRLDLFCLHPHFIETNDGNEPT
jgi:hypothetical protein